MKDNFTYRDFVVFYLTGTVAVIVFIAMFFNPVLNFMNCFLTQYPFLKDFSSLILILFVTIIYGIGHLIHTIDYLLLKIHVNIFYKTIRRTKFLNGKKVPEFILNISKSLFYNYRVINYIYEYKKSNKVENVKVFWGKWYELRMEEKHTHAEYWHRQNDLFRGLYLIFFVSTIVFAIQTKFITTIICCFFSILFYKRASQFADHFVETALITHENYRKMKNEEIKNKATNKA